MFMDDEDGAMTPAHDAGMPAADEGTEEKKPDEEMEPTEGAM